MNKEVCRVCIKEFTPKGRHRFFKALPVRDYEKDFPNIDMRIMDAEDAGEIMKQGFHPICLECCWALK